MFEVNNKDSRLGNYLKAINTITLPLILAILSGNIVYYFRALWAYLSTLNKNLMIKQ